MTQDQIGHHERLTRHLRLAVKRANAIAETFSLMAVLILASPAAALGKPVTDWQELDKQLVRTRSATDPDYLKAKAEAQKHWPLFLSHFEKKKPTDNFEVKLPISDGKTIENVWISVHR